MFKCTFSVERSCIEQVKIKNYCKMSKEKIENFVGELDSYIPRALRLGLPKSVDPSFVCMDEVSEEVPLLDDLKRPCGSLRKFRKVKSVDSIGKFKASDFDIDMLQAAGVPLSVVNINQPSSRSMEEIDNAITRLGSLEEVARKLDEQNAERDSWFRPSQSSVDNNSSNSSN